MNNTDKEKLIKSLQNIIDSGWGSVEIDSGTVEDIIAMLKEQESKIDQLNRFVNGFSLDAVPVVRCKDCEYHGTYKCYITFEEERVPDDDWHCADGVKKKRRSKK